MNNFQWMRIISCLLAALVASCATQSVQQSLEGPLVLDKQGSFFVGGHSLASDTLSTLPAYAASGTVAVEPMYVRYQVPSQSRRLPLVLIHGCCLTGKPGKPRPTAASAGTNISCTAATRST